jgi:hypothetical protein
MRTRRRPMIELYGLAFLMERDGNEATVKKDVATLSKLADDWSAMNATPAFFLFI